MSDRKRIFVYRDIIDGGGSWKILRDMLFYFNDIGYEVYVIARICTDNLWHREDGHTNNIRLFVLGDARYWSHRTISKVRELFDDGMNILVTFADAPVKPFLVNFCKIIKNKKVFWVYMETNHPSLFKGWYRAQVKVPSVTQKLVHDSVDLIRLENENFDKYIDATNKKKIFSFYNLCTLPTEVNKIDTRHKFNIINIHGFREPHKSILPFLEVMRRVREKRLDIGLYVVGKVVPHLKVAAVRYIRGHQLQDYVTILDTVPNIHDYYASMDMYVSTAKWEGTSNAVLEALAHGLPVICPRYSLGVRETVEDGKTGYVCDDIDMMFDKVQECYQNAELYAKLSDNAKKFSMQYVSVESSVKRWKDAIDLVGGDYTQSNDILNSRHELIRKVPMVVN